MKKLIIGQEVLEAERIVVDRNKGEIIGYNGKQEVFALRGVDFSLLNYEVEGGEDAPEPSETDLLGQVLVELELRLMQLEGSA